MKTANKIFSHQTKQSLNFIDITEEIKSFIAKSNIQDGLVNVQILHTSAALIVNENEPLLWEDFKKNIEKTAPSSLSYQHDDFTKRTVNLCKNEYINGHSHCQAIHLSVSVTLNLIKGELQLGQWQRVMLVELDRSRVRKVQVQIIGD